MFLYLSKVKHKKLYSNKLKKYLIIAILGLFFSNYNGYSQIYLYNIEYGTDTYNKSQQLFDEQLLRESELKVLDAINKFPDNPAFGKSELLRAKIDLISGNYEVSLNTLQQFIEKHPNSPLVPEANLQIAYIYLEQGKYPDAQKAFDKSIVSIENDILRRTNYEYLKNLEEDATYWKAIATYQQGRYLEAIPIFQELVQKHPQSKYADDALFGVGMIYERNRQYDSAIIQFNLIENNYPYSNSVLASYIRSANNNIVQRKATRAFFDLEYASNIYNHIQTKDSLGLLYEQQSYVQAPFEEINYLRGEAYNVVGNYTEAKSTFKAFLESYTVEHLRLYFVLGLGWASLNLEQYDEALQYYEQVISEAEESEKNIRYLAELYRAITLEKSGQIDDAQRELANLASRADFPYSGVALLELAQINYEAENYNDAKKNLIRAKREENSGRIAARIHLLLGATYLQLGNYSDALDEYDKANIIVSNSDPVLLPEKKYYESEILFKKSICLIQTHRYAEAISNLNNFIGAHPKDARIPEALFWLAESYYRTDLLKNAQKTYNQLMINYPNFRREDVLYGLGWSYFRDRNFKGSSDIFSMLAQEFPKSKYAVEVLTRQGDGYYLQKDYLQAANFYSQAAKLSPKSDEGQYSAYQLCHALCRSGKYEDTITSLLNFVGNYPNSQYAPNAIYLIGWIKFNQKQYVDAINNYSYLIDAYPQSSLVPRAYYAIGDAYYNQGNFYQAIAYYKKVVELFPSNTLAPEALKSMQYCYTALGKEDEAIAIAEQYIQSNPNSPYIEEFAFKKGEMFYTGKKYQDAITEYEKFIADHPGSDKDPEALYWMGKSYQNLNEKDKAIKVFSDLFKKYPKSEFAAQGLIELATILEEKTFLQSADSVYTIISQNFDSTDYDAQAIFQRASIAAQMNDTLKSIDLYKTVAQKYPTSIYGLNARYRIAMYYRSNSMNDEARKEFEVLSSISTDNDLTAEALYRIGELWMRDQNWDKAIETFTIVKDKYTNVEVWFPLSLLNLGEAYEKKGQNDLAIDIYKALTAINPDDDYGRTARNRLKNLTKTR